MADPAPILPLALGVRRGPLADVAPATFDGVTLTPRGPLNLIEIAAVASAVFDPAAFDPAAFDPAWGEAMAVGPGRWLLTAPDDDAGRYAAVRSAFSRDGASVIDQSSGRAAIRVAGSRTRDLLAKSTPLDLSPGTLPSGTAAGTLCGHIAVLLHAPKIDATDVIDAYVARSLARDLWWRLAADASAL